MTAPAADGSPLAGCLEACRRLDAVLDRIQASGTAAGGPHYLAVGPHVRHCLDHFRSLLTGLTSGTVDYDARGRDPREERDLAAAREALRTLTAGLRRLESAPHPQALRVVQSASPAAPPVSCASSLARELAFLSGHTIHHLAIVTQILRSRGLSLPEDLSLAFSTMAHRSSRSGEAR